MKLTYLGTAAAEGWPALFCNCEFCKKAREAGGKNLRSRSQAIIDDDFLIDFPGDTYMHAINNNINIAAARYALITHTHEDHFDLDDLYLRGNVYSHNHIASGFTFIGNPTMDERVRNYIKNIDNDFAKVDSEIIPLFTPKKYGDYTVTALKADHDGSQESHVYIIEKQGKTILYLHDTGSLPAENHEYLKKSGIKADLISYDCTCLKIDCSSGHMGLKACADEREKLKADGVVKEDTIHIINHFSHNGGYIHDELVPIAYNMGFLTAYDGMSVEI